MNTYKILSACFGIIILIGVLLLPHKGKNEPLHDEWNTFRDVVNNWEISYPNTITDIELADDDGPKNWLDNIIFKDNEHWVFSLLVKATTSPNTSMAPLPEKNSNEKSFELIQNNKDFIIRTQANAPVEKILSGLKTEL